MANMCDCGFLVIKNLTQNTYSSKFMSKARCGSLLGSSSSLSPSDGTAPSGISPMSVLTIARGSTFSSSLELFSASKKKKLKIPKFY